MKTLLNLYSKRFRVLLRCLTLAQYCFFNITKVSITHICIFGKFSSVRFNERLLLRMSCP